MLQKITYDAETNDLTIMRDIRRLGLHVIRCIPGRGERKTIVYAVEKQD